MKLKTYSGNAFEEIIQIGHETRRIHLKKCSLSRPLHLQILLTSGACHHHETGRKTILTPFLAKTLSTEKLSDLSEFAGLVEERGHQPGFSNFIIKRRI